MAETLTNSGSVKIRIAPSGDLPDICNNPDDMTEFINQAEAFVMAEAKVDFVSGYSGYPSTKKKILDAATSSLAACWIIDHDPSVFQDTRTSEMKRNVQWATFRQAMGLLKNKEISEDFVTK